MSKSTTKPSTDNLEWLLAMRDHHGRVRDTAFAKEDFLTANEHDPLCHQFFLAAEEVRKNRELLIAMTEVMRNRIIIALVEAKAPVWEPTHRHYKGDLYRMTGIRWDAEHEELNELVEYDNIDGKKFCISKRRWDSLLDSGKPRYQYLYEGSERHG